jgi:crossover junction endodeoxyribonuclease RusA
MSARTWTIELPYPSPPLSANDRNNRHKTARIRNDVMHTVHAYAIAEWLPRGLDRVGIVLHWRVSTKHRRDADNLAPTLKACVDGLTRGSRNHPGFGLTVDDDWQHVTSGWAIELDRTQPSGLWLEITDLSEQREAS